MSKARAASASWNIDIQKLWRDLAIQLSLLQYHGIIQILWYCSKQYHTNDKLTLVNAGKYCRYH